MHRYMETFPSLEKDLFLISNIEQLLDNTIVKNMSPENITEGIGDLKP